MWHALSWLHDVPGPTMLFYLVISCSYNLVIILHNSYSSGISHVCYICHIMHARSYCTWSIILIFFLLLLLSVLDTAKHIVLMSYLLLLHLRILFFIVLFPSCTLAGLLLTDHYYYYSIFRSASWYGEMIVEYILAQLFSSEFSSFSWLVLFRYSGWYCSCFSIS